MFSGDSARGGSQLSAQGKDWASPHREESFPALEPQAPPLSLSPLRRAQLQSATAQLYLVLGSLSAAAIQLPPCASSDK